MPRPTPVRDALLAALSERAEHARSLEELTALLRRRGMDADFSSVFRAAQHLEREGKARKVDLGDRKTRYEAPGKHHDHVICEKCGTIEAVPSCPVPADPRQLERKTGYRIKGHSLVFSGVCPACASRD